MKKELRGRRIKDYDINYIADLSWIMETDENISDEQIVLVNEEYGCDISGISDKEAIIELIRKFILEMYNDAITSSVMLLYSFLIWYKNTVNRLERLGKIEEREKLLDFQSILNSNVISNLGSLLSQKYDRDNVDEYINHLSYRKTGEFDQLRVFGNNRIPEYDIDHGKHQGKTTLHVHYYIDGKRATGNDVIQLYPGHPLYEKYKKLFKGVKL